MTETPADPRLARIIAEARAIRGDIDDIIRAAEANDIDELSRVAAIPHLPDEVHQHSPYAHRRTGGPAVTTPPRRRLVYVRRASDGRWLVHFGYPPCDVYDTWAEAIHAATALRRKPGILPALPPRERRERVRDEYRHFRSLGLPHGVTCDRLATVYRLAPGTTDKLTRDLRNQPHTHAA